MSYQSDITLLAHQEAGNEADRRHPMKTQTTNPDPSRSGIDRVPSILTYRPPAGRAGIPVRVWVTVRFAFGALLAVVGALVLTFDSDRWIGLVLVAGGALSFWLGYLAMAGARSASHRI
jgi:predicted lysophospholipase L1 biosynthesis ABC-type transport system permease subunit